MPRLDSAVEPAEDPCAKPIFEYVRTVISLIERRRVSPDEIFWMLEQIFRQHRLGQNCRTAYACGQSNKSPP